VKIQTKPNNDDIVVVIDPYKPKNGNFPRSLTPNIALYSHGIDESITLSGDPFTLTTPGECETKGVLVTAIHGATPGTLLIRIDAEGLSVGHLGLTSVEPTTEQLDVVGGVDILMLPVGGNGGYDPETAAKVVSAIEPRVVIPLAFASDNDPKMLPVSSFLKELGVAATAPEKKVIIKKKDLPTDEMSVIVLEKE
jgi:L-ascorbate metabolism protein UlaG (beta-lactamase superfamily)